MRLWPTIAFTNYPRFIDTFGTHIIVGMKMGGKDVIYLKQQHSSNLQPADVQKKLKEMADRRFLDANGQYSITSDQVFPNNKVGETMLFLFMAAYLFIY